MTSVCVCVCYRAWLGRVGSISVPQESKHETTNLQKSCEQVSYVAARISLDIGFKIAFMHWRSGTKEVQLKDKSFCLFHDSVFWRGSLLIRLHHQIKFRHVHYILFVTCIEGHALSLNLPLCTSTRRPSQTSTVTAVCLSSTEASSVMNCCLMTEEFTRRLQGIFQVGVFLCNQIGPCVSSGRPEAS